MTTRERWEAEMARKAEKNVADEAREMMNQGKIRAIFATLPQELGLERLTNAVCDLIKAEME